MVDIKVEYEWIPPTCKKCKSFGHVDNKCPTKETELNSGIKNQKKVGDGVKNLNSAEVNHIGAINKRTHQVRGMHLQ